MEGLASTGWINEFGLARLAGIALRTCRELGRGGLSKGLAWHNMLIEMQHFTC
jgi:hypothetical protein